MKFTFDVNVSFKVSVDAETEELAKQMVYDMSEKELVENSTDSFRDEILNISDLDDLMEIVDPSGF